MGFQVILCFSIAQHSRDKLLLSKISEYLACGYIPKGGGLTRPDGAEFVVYKFSDISEKNYRLSNEVLLCRACLRAPTYFVLGIPNGVTCLGGGGCSLIFESFLWRPFLVFPLSLQNWKDQRLRKEVRRAPLLVFRTELLLRGGVAPLPFLSKLSFTRRKTFGF